MKPSPRVEMMPIGQCAASELHDGKLGSQPPPHPPAPVNRSPTANQTGFQPF